MTLGRKMLLGVLALVLAAIGGCGIGLLALAPAEGPPMLRALPTDADVVAYAEDIDTLWKTLESSEGFAEFRRGPAWRALLEGGLGEGIKAIEGSGLELTRSRASHLVGREAGVALWLDPTGRRITSWLVAFRIDIYVRIIELAAGRLFLTDGITRRGEGGATVADLRRGSGGLYWALLGDLFLVTGDRDLLLRSAEGIDTRGDDTSFAGVFQSALESKAGSTRAGVRLGRPERLTGMLLDTALLGGRSGHLDRRTARSRLTRALRALGLPAPADRITIATRLDGSRLLEEAFVTSPVPVPRKGGAIPDIAPPPDTFFWWRFLPGRQEASDYAWAIFVMMVPPKDRGRGISRSGVDIFEKTIVPRVGTDVAIALADQDVTAEGGGFPAQYTFVGMKGAGLLSAGFEQLMRSRSLGIYSESERLPVSYPYVVRRHARGRAVYEMAIRDTRRFEGFRPSVTVRANDVTYCSSLEGLVSLQEAPRGFRPSPTIFARLRADEWMSPDGVRDDDEVFRLEWRPPRDFRQLRNAYDYLTELRRYRAPRPVTGGTLPGDDTDYARLWRTAQDVLKRVHRHSRVGFDVPGGMRMRAVWDFAEGE